MIDSLGDRMKEYEHTYRIYLPRRGYTLIRIDGKTFHTYTKTCLNGKSIEFPYDKKFMDTMNQTALSLCSEIQGCKLGYIQSDEITLLLTDFDDLNTCAWFDNNIQKITSVSSSMATAYFNQYMKENFSEVNKLAFFDSRTWFISDPWEVYNTFLWRQRDATKNAIQALAQSLYSHKELQNKNGIELQEMIFQRGINFNDCHPRFKKGAFIIKNEFGWWIDNDVPIVSQDKEYILSKIPLLKGWAQNEKY